MKTIYTIGHSNRELGEFMNILKQTGITILVDVRAVPQSEHNPQFNEDSLRAACEASGISYLLEGGQLGGRREAMPDSIHVALDEGMRGYADYMQTVEFEQAARQLINLAEKGVMAIMCAERDPMQCHRSLISDYLLLHGVEVVHLINADTTQVHVLRPEARRESAELIYDRHATGKLGM